MTTDYEIKIILAGGCMAVVASGLSDQDVAEEWALELSKQPGVANVIVTQTAKSVVCRYEKGKSEYGY